MATEYSRLSTVVSFWILSVASYIEGWLVDVEWDWLGLTARGFTFVFLGVAVVISVDFILYRFSERIREIGSARVYPASQLAHALKGLTSGQTDLVRAFNVIDIEMIIGDTGPMYQVVCLTRKVPWEDVEEYLLLSMTTPGFLYPISHYRDWRKAQAIKDLIVSNGWAKETAKLAPAQLTKPLGWIAARFGVELRGTNIDELVGEDIMGDLDNLVD